MAAPKTPLLTVDIIIELIDHPGRPIVLIERRYPPLGWALPGGFVDVGETLEHAAVREAKEETGLDVDLSMLLGCYSDPARDARSHTVSAVYIAQAQGQPRADDDAKSVRLLSKEEETSDLVFDHARIVSDYRRYRTSGQPAPLNKAKQMV